MAGDLDAYATLVEAHHAGVFRVALRMLHDRQSAEDATQDTFIRAWRALGRFEQRSSLRTWLYRIVTNRCLREIERSRRMTDMPDELTSPSPGPDRVAVSRAELHVLRDVIAKLPPSQRAALVLRELEGCSYQEVADVLDISLAAVKTRLHRARRAVLDGMQEWS